MPRDACAGKAKEDRALHKHEAGSFLHFAFGQGPMSVGGLTTTLEGTHTGTPLSKEKPMRPFLALFAVVLLGSAVLCTGDQGSTARDSSEPPQQTAPPASGDVLLHVLQSVPAHDVSNSLSKLFRDEPRLTIVPDTLSNALLIRASEEVLDEVIDALKTLDRPPKVATFAVHLVQVTSDKESVREALSGPRDQVKRAVSELQSDGDIFVSDRIELTTLENQPAHVQVGRQTPMVTGTNVTPRGRMSSYDTVNVGTMVSLTFRANDKGVVLDLKFEKSDIEQTQAEPDDDEQNPLPPDVTTTTLQTTVSLGDGQAIVVEGVEVHSKDGTKQKAFLVVSAQIRNGNGPKPPAKRPSTPRTERSTAPRSPAEARSRSDDSRYATFARMMFKRYDRDDDGVVAGDEWPDSRTPISEADADGDKKVTIEEMTRWMVERSKGSRPASSGTSGSDSRFTKYAQGLLKKYDTNDDGRLDAQERSEMQADPADADVNGDGTIDVKELTDWLLKRQRGAS